MKRRTILFIILFEEEEEEFVEVDVVETSWEGRRIPIDEIVTFVEEEFVISIKSTDGGTWMIEECSNTCLVDFDDDDTGRIRE